MRRLAWGWVLLLALGCGDDLDGETLIGAPCSEDAECDVGEVGDVCVTTVEPGLCARPCDNPGVAQECPLGSFCDRQELATEGEAEAAMTLCLPACERDSDCRDGYRCNGVSSGSGKVCSPKK